MKYKIILLTLLLPLLTMAQEQRNFSLEEAIIYAQENSYAVLNADDEIAKAQKKVWETTTMGLPQINATIDYQNYIQKPVQLVPAEFFGGQAGEFAEISFGTKQNVNASATLSQLIFDGSYIVGLQSSRVYLKISEIAKQKTTLAIKEGVINAYAGVLMAREGINILEKNIENISQNLDQTREIVKNGFGEEQDVEQLALTLNSIVDQLKTMQKQEQYTMNMLKYVMGIPIGENIELTETLESLATSYSSELILDQAFTPENHIDYLISENTINANELLIKLEKSKALPSLGAFINYGINANSETFSFLKSDQKWYDLSLFGVSMSVPIFSSLKRVSRVQQAKIDLDISKRNQVETSEKLNLAYETAKLNYQSALDTYQNAKEALRLAESIEHKESIKFYEGISGSFEWSNAQNQLYDKQQKYLQSIFNLINNKAALESALGD